MIGLAFSAAPTGLVTGLLAAYALVGIAGAVVATRRQMGLATAVGALVCWPLLLPLLGAGHRRSSHGPLAPRIAAAVDALRTTLDDPAAASMDGPEDLDGLIAALYRADERLALVDHLLDSVAASDRAPAQGGLAQSLADLRRARAAAAAEVEAVLEGLAQLRIQIGLRSLVGDSVPVRERLRDLRARLAAVDELAQLELRNDTG
jgi:hypothetical protein